MLGAAAAWAATGASARAQTPASDRTQVIGTLTRHRVKPEETLHDVARAYDVGFVELRAANPGMNPWVPPGGAEIVIPTAHVLPYDAGHRMVINRADFRLYYFPPSGPPRSWPIGVGREEHQTPLGVLHVTEKRVAPSWRPTPSMLEANPDLPRVVPPGPANPLGDFAVRIGWDSYAVHGTNKPDGIGRRVSHGCVRLYPEDIEVVFALIQVGDAVRIADEPAKLGWLNGELYMEVHPSGAMADEVESTGRFTLEAVEHLDTYVEFAAGPERRRVNWDAVRSVERERRGVPVRITT